MHEQSQAADVAQDRLERQLFHLKTLYDISREMLGETDTGRILKNFLLMTTGNFGTIDGFVLLRESGSGGIGHYSCVGFNEERGRGLETRGESLLAGRVGDAPGDASLITAEGLPASVVCSLSFTVDEDCTGLLGLGSKIVGEPYSDEDNDLLLTLVNNLVITLKNARHAEALRSAYEEVSSLNRAKDKMINHLSHELKTPMAVVQGSLKLLGRHLKGAPGEKWKRIYDRAERNLDRLLEIQDEVDDIVHGEAVGGYHLLRRLLDGCGDELEVLLAEKGTEGAVVEWLRGRIEEVFGSRECEPEEFSLGDAVFSRLQRLAPEFSHRRIDLGTDIDAGPRVFMPREPVEKVLAGLVKNAVENTPDGGRVTVAVQRQGECVRLKVADTGVGILADHRKRIFEGFFPTQETAQYATKVPFDFNAGGKGADLLRMKIFSERYSFDLKMDSSRCILLEDPENACPGDIENCARCQKEEDCFESGGSTFEAVFPVAPAGSPPGK